MLTTDRQLPCSLSLHDNFCCCTGVVTVVKVVQKLSLPGVLLNNNHAFMDLLQLLVHRLFLGKVLQANQHRYGNHCCLPPLPLKAHICSYQSNISAVSVEVCNSSCTHSFVHTIFAM